MGNRISGLSLKNLFSKNITKKLILLLIVSIVYLFLFSYNTNPFVKYYYGDDSAMFLFMGKAMKNNMLLYKDIFDHKGPILFFIQQLGQIICDGKIGIFILQIINLSILLIILDKIICINKSVTNKRRYIYIVLVLWVLSYAYAGGNFCEEWSLPPLLLCLLCFIKQNKLNDFNHRMFYFIYGLSFGYVFFIRPNNCFYICAIMITIFIIMLRKKEYKSLLIGIFIFICVFALFSVLVLVYFYFKGTLNEMVYSTIIFPLTYATQMSFLERCSRYLFTYKFLPYVLLQIVLPYLIIKYSSLNNNEVVFVITTSLMTFIATIMGNVFNHYFMLLIPNFTYCLFIIEKESLYRCISSINILIKCLIIILVIIQTSSVLIEVARTVFRITDYDRINNTFDLYKRNYDSANEILSYIPEEERNSIYASNCGTDFYLYTNTYPCIKYFNYIDQHANYLDVKENIKKDILTITPKYIVETKKNIQLDIINNILNDKYRFIASDDKDIYYLYELIQSK